MKHAKIVAGLALAAAVAGPAQAQTAVRQTLEEVNNCAAVPDAQARLACYDGAIPKVRSALNVATQEDQFSLFGLDIFSGGSDGVTNEATRPEDFGREDLPSIEVATTDGVISEITAPLAEIARNSTGYDVYVLDNGQVWRAQEVSKISLPRNPTGIKVRIRTGAMGAYYLSRDGQNRSVRVERVR